MCENGHAKICKEKNDDSSAIENILVLMWLQKKFHPYVTPYKVGGWHPKIYLFGKPVYNF